MKQSVSFMITVILSICLCGCASSTGNVMESKEPEQTEEVTATESTSTELKEQENEGETTDSASQEDVSDPGFTKLLTDMSQGYHQGTAGCSLVGAKYAGMILDWYAGTDCEASEITAMEQEFYESLEEEAATEYQEQLDGVYGCAKELLKDTAADLLDTAGYTPEAYPWSNTDVTEVFTALYEGIGEELPD